MKRYSLLTLLGAVTLTAVQAQAHENRAIEGQMTVYSPVYLIDRNHNQRELSSGTYNIFISNDHHNITFRRSTDSDDQRIVINMPSDDVDLNNFVLPVSSTGQGYDLNASSNYTTSSGGSYIETVTCYEGDWYGQQQYEVRTSVSSQTFTLAIVADGNIQAQFQGVSYTNQGGSSRTPISGCTLIGPILHPVPVYPVPVYPGPVYHPVPVYPVPVYPGPGHVPGQPNPPAHPIPGSPGHQPGQPNPPAHPI